VKLSILQNINYYNRYVYIDSPPRRVEDSYMEHEDLLKINAIIQTAYRGSNDKSLYSDYDVLFNALQTIETMVEDELENLWHAYRRSFSEC